MEFVFLLHQQFIYLLFNSYRRLNHFRRKLVSSIKAVSCFHRVPTLLHRVWSAEKTSLPVKGRHGLWRGKLQRQPPFANTASTENAHSSRRLSVGKPKGVWVFLIQPAITASFRSRHFCRALCHCLSSLYERTITKWGGNTGIVGWLNSRKFTDFFFSV